MKIPLEDLFEDIIGKAQRGLKLSDDEVSAKAGLALSTLNRLRTGSGTRAEVDALARALELKPEPLWESFQRSWEPEAVNVDGLEQVNADMLGFTVNTYLVWDPSSRSCALFDAGIEPARLFAIRDRRNLKIESIFITHTHEDHVAALKEIAAKTSARVFGPSRESVSGATSVQEGDRFEIGNLKVEARLTNGHSPGGISYVIEGLSVPVAVVGDSLFAGSMGGAPNAYSLALTNNREKLMTLPAGTVVCPGHGPMTTVGEEHQHNPFVGS
ncbi:MAG TPA: MBL fold metallo-hydrolase [Chthoniobacterales bacterium]|jgi:glyoxylase-like metal-dependent hydrolase (beta-lactamase superfamily II)|nr:MBL fold metallo-hydrolase [Chthoniobacterales bacterium]